MKIKTMLFAAASLLALANATANLAVDPLQQTGLVADELKASQIDCNEECHEPWKTCMRSCRGGSKWCEYKCNCDLFNDDDNICRKSGEFQY